MSKHITYEIQTKRLSEASFPI